MNGCAPSGWIWMESSRAELLTAGLRCSGGNAAGFSATHLRGGSWNNNRDNARAAYRNNNDPSNRNNNTGFRVVCVVRPTPLVPLHGALPAPGGAGPSPFIRDRRLPEMPAEYA